MKRFFQQNKIVVGVVAELLSLVLVDAVLYLVLLLLSQNPATRLSWFAVGFVAGVLVLRGYAKRKEYPRATKSEAVVLFISFIAYIFILSKNGGL